MKNLKDISVKNKKVLVRCDFNVSIENGVVVDDFRIKEAMPTIRSLSARGAKVVLMSHLGRPKKQKSFKEEGVFSSLKDFIFDGNGDDSLKPVYRELSKHLDKIFFVNDCIGSRVERRIKRMTPGDVLLLENLRYYKEEEECDEDFSKMLSRLGDIYVNNAFSVSHRNHASISGVTNYLKSYPGLLLERETRVLGRLKKRVNHPFVVIVGGAKIDSKMKTVDCFVDRADAILLGGKVANTILIAKGLATNKPLPDEETIKRLEKIDPASPKFRLPVDVIASSDEGATHVREAGVGEVRKKEEIYDIGPETIEIYSNVIREARTIVWAGPLGYFEKKEFRKGTEVIAKRIIENSNALSVIGGGDTGYALKMLNLREYVDHISAGGGAMLSFLSNEKMPGLEALN